jgi:hypothetical protein
MPSVLVAEKRSRTEGVVAHAFHEASQTVVLFPKECPYPSVSMEESRWGALFPGTFLPVVNDV